MIAIKLADPATVSTQFTVYGPLEVPAYYGVCACASTGVVLILINRVLLGDSDHLEVLTPLRRFDTG